LAKLEAMRILRFGKYGTQVPAWNDTRYFDHPLPDSMAEHATSLNDSGKNDRKYVKFAPTQTLFGDMIQRPAQEESEEHHRLSSDAKSRAAALRLIALGQCEEFEEPFGNKNKPPPNSVSAGVERTRTIPRSGGATGGELLVGKDHSKSIFRENYIRARQSCLKKESMQFLNDDDERNSKVSKGMKVKRNNSSDLNLMGQSSKKSAAPDLENEKRRTNALLDLTEEVEDVGTRVKGGSAKNVAFAALDFNASPIEPKVVSPEKQFHSNNSKIFTGSSDDGEVKMSEILERARLNNCVSDSEKDDDKTHESDDFIEQGTIEKIDGMDDIEDTNKQGCGMVMNGSTKLFCCR